MAPVTRRQWLTGVAAFPMLGPVPEAAVRLVGPLGEQPLPPDPPLRAPAPGPIGSPPTLRFVDYKGWIVTVADRDAIRGSG